MSTVVNGNFANQIKYAVVQTKSKKYGQCALDIQYADQINKVKFTLVNKPGEAKGIHTEHYLNVDDFLVLANDILTGQFKTYKDKDAKAKYVEYKGSPRTKDGKAILESRIFEIEYLVGNGVPYIIKLSAGKGEKIGNGAVKMVGKPERETGIFLTEFQMKKIFKMSTLYIEDIIRGKSPKHDEVHHDTEDNSSDEPAEPKDKDFDPLG